LPGMSPPLSAVLIWPYLGGKHFSRMSDLIDTSYVIYNNVVFH
jgi:hypothetical protein